jgi:hypothetical protein
MCAVGRKEKIMPRDNKQGTGQRSSKNPTDKEIGQNRGKGSKTTKAKPVGSPAGKNANA